MIARTPPDISKKYLLEFYCQINRNALHNCGMDEVYFFIIFDPFATDRKLLCGYISIYHYAYSTEKAFLQDFPVNIKRI